MQESTRQTTPFHDASVQIEDSVLVQAVDLHMYDAFLSGKAGAAV